MSYDRSPQCWSWVELRQKLVENIVGNDFETEEYSEGMESNCDWILSKLNEARGILRIIMSHAHDDVGPVEGDDGAAVPSNISPALIDGIAAAGAALRARAAQQAVLLSLQPPPQIAAHGAGGPLPDRVVRPLSDATSPASKLKATMQAAALAAARGRADGALAPAPPPPPGPLPPAHPLHSLKVAMQNWQSSEANTTPDSPQARGPQPLAKPQPEARFPSGEDGDYLPEPAKVEYEGPDAGHYPFPQKPYYQDSGYQNFNHSKWGRTPRDGNRPPRSEQPILQPPLEEDITFCNLVSDRLKRITVLFEGDPSNCYELQFPPILSPYYRMMVHRLSDQVAPGLLRHQSFGEGANRSISVFCGPAEGAVVVSSISEEDMRLVLPEKNFRFRKEKDRDQHHGHREAERDRERDRDRDRDRDRLYRRGRGGHRSDMPPRGPTPF